MNRWLLKYVWEENIWCPNCKDEFEDIGEEKKKKNTARNISLLFFFVEIV